MFSLKYKHCRKVEQLMADVKNSQERDELYRAIWNIANDLSVTVID